MKPTFKLNDKVEFLETPVKNWRWGKIVEINKENGTYRIYSGTDMFLARPVESANGKTLELRSI
jgi:hypothetical protein